MSIDKRVIDDLLREFRTPEQILGKDSLIKRLTKAVLERALDAELALTCAKRKPSAWPAWRPLRAPLSPPAATSATVTR